VPLLHLMVLPLVPLAASLLLLLLLLPILL
jgi:hypothetical protein